MLRLSLDLFSSPTGGSDGARGEIARSSGFLDEFGDPVLLIIVRQRSIGESFTEITVFVSKFYDRGSAENTYAIIPIQARRRPSLWFMSRDTVSKNSRIGWMDACKMETNRNRLVHADSRLSGS